MGLGRRGRHVPRDLRRLRRSRRKFPGHRRRLHAGQERGDVGKFISERGLRDQLVLATKFTFNARPGNPNAGGNGRKNIYRALEGSLRRLKTDYIDLYWLHAWDTVTPVEEVVYTLNDLVRHGKIRHYGFSDTPAWYVARAQTIAEKEGKERIAALQLEYSLVERNIEREHIPAAQELGIAVCPWSPLGRRVAHRQIQARGRQRNGRRASGENQSQSRSSIASPSATGASPSCWSKPASSWESRPRKWRSTGWRRSPASPPPSSAPPSWSSSRTTWRRSSSRFRRKLAPA